MQLGGPRTSPVRPGARGSAFGLTALGLASVGVRYFKTAPFETDCPWVSEDGRDSTAISFPNLVKLEVVIKLRLLWLCDALAAR